MKKLSTDAKTLLNMVSATRYDAKVAYEMTKREEKHKKKAWNIIYIVFSVLEEKMYTACGINRDDFFQKHSDTQQE